ncbi:MAG: bifunctional diguanylate cyclase/phosphodiesterase, partial [Desulfobacca sp.]|nr:bifunctional diguanylate cyclase/phosphodiesterase [Desulfobacca sp.]
MNSKRILTILLVLFLALIWAMAAMAQEKATAVQIDLTAEERAFLVGKQLRLGVDSARPPFEYLDEKGVYSGISAGFIQDCAKRLGVSIGVVPGLTVSAAMEKAKAGEIDEIPKITPTPEREKHLIFTKAYVTFPSVIISRKEARFIGGLDDLDGLKIGVLKGLVVEELLKRDYPQLPLIPLSDVKKALLELSTGKIDVFVDNLGTVTYNIDKLGLTNLKIAAPTPYNHDLAFGIRK